MSTWRRMALELFPDLRMEFQKKNTTPYSVFFNLLPRCRQAHKEGNEEQLHKIYDYAEWCFRQKAKDVWNAAGVAFYEHLVDSPVTRSEIPKWIKPDLFQDLASLFECRLGKEGFDNLKRNYDARRHFEEDKNYQKLLRADRQTDP